MRPLIPFLAMLAVLASCRTHKEMATEKTLATDSVSQSEHHRTIAVLDSAVRSISFDFDTLEVNIERPSAIADIPETIRLRAVKGNVREIKRYIKDSIEHYNSVDSVAYRQSQTGTISEHTATTRLYNPPSGTAIAITGIIVVAILIFACRRKQ